MKTLNIFICLLLCLNLIFSQTSEKARVVWSSRFNDLRVFIENKGQFPDIDGEKVLYAYLADKEKYYLTSNGLIIRIDTVVYKENPLKKIANFFIENSDNEEKEREYYQYQHKYIKATWKGIDLKKINIIPIEKKSNYYTFYGVNDKCYGYNKILYQNLYPNIDLEYYIPQDKKTGIKYNIIVHSNANLEDVSLIYSGDVNNLKLDNYGGLIIENDIHPLSDRFIKTYYLNNPNKLIQTFFILNNNEVKFYVEQKTDTGTLVIDPWVSGIGLSGDDYGYDVEYDFTGNLYVYVRQAGGNLTVQKFSPTGNIIWTHIVTSDNTYDGNFLVDKISNKLYVCEGFNAGGAQAYRLNLDGTADGFISQQNGSFREMWDMIFDCKMNRIIGIGGGTSSNLNGGLINPTNGTVSIANFTGVGGTCQDVVNGCVDNQGRVFVFFAVPTDGASMPIANKLMQLNPTLNGYVWSVDHGMYSFQECSNHPFLDAGCGSQNSNAYNAMDVNDYYLYFYDGRSLRAFNPNNGTSVAATSVGYSGQWYTPLSCGGIAVDDCNTVYVGGPNANILYYSFDGSNFNGPQNISLGWPGMFVWDLKYDRNTNLLYVSGYNGVAVVYAAPSASCINNSLTSSVTCSGANSGDVTVTVNTTLGQPTFNYTWYNSGGTQISQTLNSTSNMNTVNNLQNGTYIVQVHVNPLCGPILTDTIEVNCPNCGANVTSTPVSCYGGNNGSATITPVEGQAPFTYLWSNGDNHQTILDLSAGTYSVTFTDANNCNLVYQVTVTQPAQLQAQVVPQHLVCYNSNDGVASVIATGGTPPYHATWNNGQSGLVAQQLAPGAYSVTITDANQCTTTASTVIQNAPVLTIDASASPPALCPGNSSQLQAQGAVFYQWQPSTNLSSDTGSVVTFSSLQSGTFTYTVTGYVPHIGNNIINNGNFEMGNLYFNSQYNYNATSTVLEAEYSITPNPLNVHPNWSSCNDHTTGTGNMMVVNGSSTPNTNVWCQQVNVQPNTDYIFSAWLTSVHATNPAVLQFSINGNMLGNPFNVGATTCQWNQFFETWNSGMNTTAQICIVNQNTALSGNDFAIDDIYFAPIVYCTATDTVTVTTYPVPTSTFTVSNILCNGDAATVQYTGNASSNATFSWNWGGGNAIPGSGIGPHQVSFTNSGTYNISLTVTENGCTSQPTTVSVTNPPLLSVSAQATDVKCNGGNDGTVSSTISGGTPPYTFAWSNGAATQNLQNVPAGIYTITVTDANGCSKTAGATVNQPTPLVASVNPSQHICVGQPAYLNITASGGTPPYQYFWNGQASTASTLVYPQTTTTYQASVVDANGCTTDILTTAVYVAPPLNVNLLANTYNVCPGDPVMLTPVIWGGVGPPYVIYNQDGDVVTPPIYIYPTQSGWYTIRAEDACGSWDTARVYINVYPLPPVNILADVLQGCVPLTVQFNEINPDSGQTYVWNFGDMTNLSLSKNPVHTYTTPGVFDVTITVTSVNGCKNTVVYNDMIQVWPQPNAAFVWSPELINEIKPEVQFTNLSAGASSYQWMFGDGDSSSKVHPYHRYPGVGSYQVELVAVSNKGCTDTVYAIIKVLEQYTFYAPTAFSPDGDRVNDFFYVVAHGIKEEGFYLEVYDRWGEVIWRTEKFHKDEERSDKWDGRAKNGQIVPVGTYTWRCVFRDVMDKLHEETGAVNVIR